MKRLYSKKNLADLRQKSASIKDRTDGLVLKFSYFHFEDEKARHYATQGFARRIQVLHRCIENVFRIIPPNRIKAPSKERLYDAQINIQSFFANVYGSIDNLAWIWVFETGLADQIPRKHVGLGKGNKTVRESLPAELCTLLEARDGWLAYVTEFRDALAHRIPVYIPPGTVGQKDVDSYNDISLKLNQALAERNVSEHERLWALREGLLKFRPIIAHSTVETKNPYYFHPQMIADFLTVEELGIRTLKALAKS